MNRRRPPQAAEDRRAGDNPKHPFEKPVNPAFRF
jgi:hypothetical protein